ncbi:hypothetical protein T11_17794 [Trichinella zimbabwensis]|uniref:Uncharacterized protein n=1 Tax=Trichinella zimbabwensis TaxID=268475 RepID=A0A0V1GVR8_9BILA|nr:hypothetical protein T11_5701 [Trichinella zimbabwensis]KRZ02133.1 hypothetical protein T11_17794 [Trichinella zimbabwensis]
MDSLRELIKLSTGTECECYKVSMRGSGHHPSSDICIHLIFHLLCIAFSDTISTALAEMKVAPSTLHIISEDELLMPCPVKYPNL